MKVVRTPFEEPRRRYAARQPTSPGSSLLRMHRVPQVAEALSIPSYTSYDYCHHILHDLGRGDLAL
jgi:hypothetical protein